jgi:hypothetical protein
VTPLLDAKQAQTLLEASLDGKLPDERGRFGPFGGRYVPETLVPASSATFTAPNFRTSTGASCAIGWAGRRR